MNSKMPSFPPAAAHEDALGDRPGAAELEALYDRTVDSVKGYAKMVEKAETSFRDTAEQFRSLHARHADQLARMLGARGIETDGDGTLMGTVNQTVVTFRAFFDEIDEDVMDQIRSGEDWVLKAFDTAIAAEINHTDSSLLREMRTELAKLLAETSHIG